MHSTFGKKLLTITALVVAIWLVVAALIYTSSPFHLFLDGPVGVHTHTASSIIDEVEACKAKGQKLSHIFWRKVNLQAKEIPLPLLSDVDDVIVKSNFTHFHESKVHYLYATPKNKKNLSVLLLHGQSFSSETWSKLQTIQHISSFGYEAIALDLPGYGFSPAIENLNKTEFLHHFINDQNLQNVVLISPSMSGTFSIPYLLTQSSPPSKLAGFVPVSPVGAQSLYKNNCKGSTNMSSLHFNDGCRKVFPFLKSKPPHLGCIKIPTLIVYGEYDRSKNSALLCLLPNSQGAEIPHGKHSAYLSDPALWHKLIYNFLDVLSETLTCTN